MGRSLQSPLIDYFEARHSTIGRGSVVFFLSPREMLYDCSITIAVIWVFSGVAFLMVYVLGGSIGINVYTGWRSVFEEAHFTQRSLLGT